MMSIYYWQLLVFAVGLIGCTALLWKHKIVQTKAVVAIALTVIVALQLFKTPAMKETPAERKARQQESVIRSLAAENEDVLAALAAIDKARTANDAAALESSIADLETATGESEALKEAVASFKEAQNASANQTQEAIAKRIAELEGKATLDDSETAELATLRKQVPAWYEKLPIKLGLDLRGGTEVRLRLRPDDMRVQQLKTQLEELKTSEATEDQISKKEKELAREQSTLQDNYTDAVDVLRRRLNNSGLEEIGVTRQGNDGILIQLPGMGSDQAAQIMKRIQRLGKLEFRMVVTENENRDLFDQIMAKNVEKDMRNFSPIEARFLPETEVVEEVTDDGIRTRTDKNGSQLYDWLQDESGRFQVVEQNVQLTGEYIAAAGASPSSENPGFYDVTLRFNNMGSIVFGHVTRDNVGKHLGIVLDGKLKSAPVLKSAIMGGNAVITGNFTAEDAKNLSVVLKSGSLKVRIEKEFENTVGPTLGEDSIRQGLEAMGLGMFFVVAFMLVYYRTAGLVTNIALILNMILILAMLSAGNATLTLPGIAGLILTIGMAVDANVLIFERIREERAKGVPLGKALALGYERAFVTIVDANVTTFITALILHQFGSEAIKGFAMTLMIGIISSMFTSLVITRWIFELLLEYKLIADLKMSQLIKKATANFVGVRRIAMGLSAILIIIGLAVVVQRGEKNLGHDFTGGTLAHIALKDPMKMADARNKVASLTERFGDIGVQSYGEDKGGAFSEFVLRTKNVKSADAEGKSATTAEDFKKALAETFPLQEQGLKIGEKQELYSTPTTAFFKVDLAMPAVRSPKSVAALLEQTSLVKPYVVATGVALPELPSSESATLTISLPTKDAKSKERTDVKQWAAALAERMKDTGQSLIKLPEAVTDAKVDGTSGDNSSVVFTVKLGVKATAAELAKATEGITGLTATLLNPSERPAMSEEPVNTVTILCGVPVRNAEGFTYEEDMLPEMVREPLLALRQQGLLEFTDPFPRFVSVGRTVANQMEQDAVLALIYSMIAIFIYIWLRFQFRAAFGLGAILALIHDVLFTLGALAIADQMGWINGQIDLTIIAALLTLVGYSLNDTIVVFDRIRENLLGHEQHLEEVINRSINQTLSRTIITSGTTLLVVIALMIWGGGVIAGFAYTLLVGVLVGTYSSIFIASPVLVEFARYRARKGLPVVAAPKAEEKKG